MFSLGADSTRFGKRLASRAGRDLQAPQPFLIMLKITGQPCLLNFHTHTYVHCLVSWMLRSELGTPTVSILASHNVVPNSDSDQVPNQIVISESRQ
jgi:hypothetical protein